MDTSEPQNDLARSYGFEPQYMAKKTVAPWPTHYQKGRATVSLCTLIDPVRMGWISRTLDRDGITIDYDYHETQKAALEAALD